MHRSHTCWEVNESFIWQEVTLAGWVANFRDHWGVLFIDLRDRYGFTQVVFDPTTYPQVAELAQKFRSEWVIKITWIVKERPQWQENPNIATWKIEVVVSEVEVLSKSNVLPFEINEFTEASEEIKYKYRYLDLRRNSVQKRIIFKSEFLHFVRNWFFNNGFTEVQTPIFTVSSPEWARDFLIPSRIHPGKFYALPQAPQQYKQLLMVWGLDKYFQIAPCFRDEDTRADRHACEFYQIDVEMSFVELEDVLWIAERFSIECAKAMAPHKTVIGNKVHRMTYKEAIDTYGSDKPDMRFGCKFVDVTSLFANSWFSVFKDVVAKGGVIKAIKTSDIAMTRKDIDELTEVARNAGAAGLAYIIYDAAEWPRSPILKFFTEEEKQQLEKMMDVKPWDIVFFSANEYAKAVKILSTVRLAIRDRFNLANKDDLAFTWITDFPFYEFDEANNKIDFWHNPFSMPAGWMKAFDKADPLEIMSLQYDMACNWYEILSWSIRNHDPEVLVKAFELVWKWEEEVKEKFGAMYNAFQYWPPPHWGFAFGMDRLMMILTDEDNIREMYAFPKSWKAQDVMMWAPSIVEVKQLKELHIKTDVKNS